MQTISLSKIERKPKHVRESIKRAVFQAGLFRQVIRYFAGRNSSLAAIRVRKNAASLYAILLTTPLMIFYKGFPPLLDDKEMKIDIHNGSRFLTD
jgi:hypothetical protein